ncbi:MAG: imidazolonepropionase [Acidobacteriaceae bacterium]|nr:imidazolonepropionase [Acidobacteriaceae bacterium]
MSNPLAVVNCRQLVTLAGPARPRVREELQQLSILSDGVLLVRDGRIEAAAQTLEIGPDYDIFDAGGRVVLPGFVDAHTHPVFAGNRADEFEMRGRGASYEEIAAAGGGIRSTVRKTRAATEEELFTAAQKRAQWFLRTGTTAIEAKSGYGLSFEAELKLLLVIRKLNQAGPLEYVPTFLGAHEIPDEYRDAADKYVDLIVNEMLPEVARAGLAEYCDVFCEPNIFDVGTAERVLAAAKELGLGLRVHAEQLSRSGAAEMAAQIGAHTADHLEQIDDAGIRALAERNVQPVLLPASVYTLGSKRFAPARAMIEAGLAVVLATDFNPGSSPTPSIPFVLSLAATHMRMTPAEAITAATINAAYSIGRGRQIGSLEPGKQADFVVHDCEDYRELAYWTGIEPAFATFVRGERVYARN